MQIQLDFLGNYLNEDKLTQLSLFDEHLQPIVFRSNRSPNYTEVEKFFKEIKPGIITDYSNYWDSIKPLDCSAIFQRWLFAFMSVHTSWKANVAGYKAVKNWWEWLNKEEELRDKIQQSGVGMHNNRTRYIHKFAMEYWQSPREYVNKSKKDWVKFRNSLAEKTLGLGPAKTSFSIELCHPNSAHITCLDTHLFQMYKLDQSKDLKMYENIESHWLDMSRMWNVPPYVARCIYWDKKQNKLDSRYWSYVFES